VLGTLVIVVAFVVGGLAVVLVALRAGPKRPQQGSGRSARRAQYVAFGVLLIVIGLGVPLLSIITNAHEHSKRGPGGLELSNAQVEGQQLFVENCATCHTLNASNSVGRVGPNLDNLRPPKALVLDAIAKGRAAGKGQMPANLLEGPQASDVAGYVASVAGR
jgi:hypothetical protein